MSGKKGRSGRRSANEERKLKSLIDITYDFLVRNFHKFTQQNKIKISLEVQKKVLPSKNENSHAFTFAEFIKKTYDDNNEDRTCHRSEVKDEK